DLDHLAIGAEIVRSGMRRRAFLHVLGQAARLKHAHDLMVEGDRTRLVVDAGFLLDHRDAQPGLAEQRGGRGADRPIADNDGVIGHCFGSLASSTTLIHIASSRATRSRNSCGVLRLPSPPICSRRARTSGTATARRTSALSRSMITGGTPAGAARPNQVRTSKSASPSASCTVGTFGSA